jgi:hypothetical protein
MVDTCTITRRTGQLITDPATGKVTAETVTIYQGKCVVQSKNSATSAPEAGEHQYSIVSRQVHIPMGKAVVLDDDLITMDTSRLTPELVGKQYLVDGYTPDSFDTAARLPVKEMTS